MNMQIKLFKLIAIVSVSVNALSPLAFILLALFGWGQQWRNYIFLVGVVGLCMAYVFLLCSNSSNAVATFGLIGCCLIVLNKVLRVLQINIADGFRWWPCVVSSLGLVLIAISVARFPRPFHPCARLVGLIGLGGKVIINLLYLSLNVYVSYCDEFPERFRGMFTGMGIAGWIADIMLVVPFAALLFSDWGTRPTPCTTSSTVEKP